MPRRPDHRSEQAKVYRRWYGTTRWRAIAAHQKAIEPLCRMCAAQGKVEPAYACDHIEPHNGDEAKFWAGPFQSLCQIHHNSTKQADEHSGHQKGSDASGSPIDPNHPWAGEKT